MCVHLAWPDPHYSSQALSGCQTFQIIGTPPNAAVQKYLNDKKVPQLLASTGATRFTDPKNFPWTIAFNPNYQSEAHIYAKFILANHPNAKIGILYQNDDLGKDYVKGLKDGLGAKASSMIVAEVSYELSDPTVDSQMVTLKASGADLFYNITTPKFGAQAIKKAAELGWKPVQILDINATPVSQTLVPAFVADLARTTSTMMAHQQHPDDAFSGLCASKLPFVPKRFRDALSLGAGAVANEARDPRVRVAEIEIDPVQLEAYKVAKEIGEDSV